MEKTAVEKNALDAAWRQAGINDDHADAIWMNNAAATLRLHIAQGIPASNEKGDISRLSTSQILQQLRTDELWMKETDPLLMEAREELLNALSEYKGVGLPCVFDSDELTMISAKPAHSRDNSDVYKGARQGRLVAIKRLRLHETPGTIAQVLDWIDGLGKIWGKLEHRNITPFFGYCQVKPGQLPFLISPWMENGDARTYRHKHPEADVLKIVIWTSPAAWSIFIHSSLRQLSMEVLEGHILLDYDLTAHLSDFGISQLLTNIHTCTAAVTNAWTAPEVLSGVKATTESDIYSFASVAYELITDTRPFDYRNVNSIWVKICEGEIPGFPVEQFRELPDEGCRMWELMLHCWKFEPTERPSIHTVIAELTSIYEEVGPPVDPGN
ncbi:kinase-like domain-containing protein [Lyophyllum atratum]|nr:kinase-like domain-containing protein [Lyophyllum atratum]